MKVIDEKKVTIDYAKKNLSNLIDDVKLTNKAIVIGTDDDNQGVLISQDSFKFLEMCMQLDKIFDALDRK